MLFDNISATSPSHISLRNCPEHLGIETTLSSIQARPFGLEHCLIQGDHSTDCRCRVGLCGFTTSMRSYARDFPVVEVQSTFYDPPSYGTMGKWRAATGPKLEYTMKVWQLVTHPFASPTYRRMKRKIVESDAPGFFRDSPSVREGWQRSMECADVLSATAMLFQCPASFAPVSENIQRMRRFFERIDRPPARLLWEPRGAAWIEQRQLALSLCRDLGLVHVVDPFITAPQSQPRVLVASRTRQRPCVL